MQLLAFDCRGLKAQSAKARGIAPGIVDALIPASPNGAICHCVARASARITAPRWGLRKDCMGSRFPGAVPLAVKGWAFGPLESTAQRSFIYPTVLA